MTGDPNCACASHAPPTPLPRPARSAQVRPQSARWRRGVQTMLEHLGVGLDVGAVLEAAAKAFEDEQRLRLATDAATGDISSCAPGAVQECAGCLAFARVFRVSVSDSEDVCTSAWGVSGRFPLSFAVPCTTELDS